MNAGYPDFSFAPPRKRLQLVAEHRVTEMRRHVVRRYPTLVQTYKHARSVSGQTERGARQRHVVGRRRRRRPFCWRGRRHKHPGSAWDELIVLCAGMRWDDVKMADRHMAEHLVAHGPVLYVDPPVSHLTRLNRPDVAASLRPRACACSARGWLA